MTDAVNEEFSLAEQAYENTKISVRAELDKILSGIVREAEVGRLRDDLNSASLRLQEAATALSSAENCRAKNLIFQAVKASREIPNLVAEQAALQREVAYSESEIERTTREVEDAEAFAVALKTRTAELDALVVKFQAFGEERKRLESEIDEIRSSTGSVAEVQESIEIVKGEIVEAQNRLEELNGELENIQGHAASVQAEAEAKRSDFETLQSTLELKELELRKRKDDTYLKTIELNRVVDAIDQARKLQSSIDEEIAEVANFEIRDVEELDTESREHELLAIDAETRRLAAEIERVREQQFRARMRI